MRLKKIEIELEVYRFDELNDLDKALVNEAKAATERSYAPYSKFHVGAAVRLANGVVLQGSNQENAAYPSGLCAERVTMFYANSQYPDVAPVALAIATQTEGSFLAQPITPCGGCRQVLLETEERFRRPIEVLLYGTEYVYKVKQVRDLMPLAFDKESLV
ncbi:MAG TPA: cytidine deaminase [Paludibacteraceae bacterium]|nr:cytidine deaminase [Paludibacteraceae bacterium]HQB68935.1 cytidine deaminase [Paludibacteraceae bacterium]HRS67245.1 cytidine deaminase [Paludibacteraceae bacterium]